MHPLTPYLEGRAAPAGAAAWSTAAMPAHHRSRRGRRRHPPDRVRDARLVVARGLREQQTLRWGYELLTGGFGIDPGRLHVTVFGGDEQVPLDESHTTWQQLGVPVERTSEDNWWSNGPTGPCGPDSEIFVWTGDGEPEGTPTTDQRWVEVWNHVMMRYRRLATAARTAAAANGRHRHGPRAAHHAAGQGLGLRDLRCSSRGCRSSRAVAAGRAVAADRHRPPALERRGHRRRRPPVEHRPWLRAAPAGPPGADPAVARRPSRSRLGDLPTEPFEPRWTTSAPGRRRPSPRVLHGEETGSAADERGRPVVSPPARSRGPLTDDDFRYLHDTHGLPRELVVDRIVPR